MSSDVGQDPELQLRLPYDLKDKQLIHLQPVCTHTSIFFFILSTVFSKLTEIVLYCKAGFVLDGFAQLQANGSALSMLKMAGLKVMMLSRSGVFQCVFNL